MITGIGVRRMGHEQIAWMSEGLENYLITAWKAANMQKKVSWKTVSATTADSQPLSFAVFYNWGVQARVWTPVCEIINQMSG